MSSLRRSLPALLVVLLLAWHALMVWPAAWDRIVEHPGGGRDYATYHYAVKVAVEGGDPYDTRALRRAARADGARAGIHPYLYPPPFLLTARWTAPLDLMTGYRTWFWVDAAASLLAGLVLWAWWRPLSPWVGPAIAAALAFGTAIPNNHVMGQANLPGLGLALLALWADHRGRGVAAGLCMGAACMMKMSPALFVGWWLLQRRWLQVGVACLTAVALTVVSLPLVGAGAQLGFYTEVLPGFGSGDYNGLTVPISLFGNHSIPDLWHRAFPGGETLSLPARVASALCTLGLIAGLAIAFRRPPEGGIQWAGQASAIGIALLLIPVYTYEHHLVWALPAVVLVVVAAWSGRLPRWTWLPILFAVGIWGMDLTVLRRAWRSLSDVPVLAFGVRELKFASLWVLLGLTAWLGATDRGAPGTERAIGLPSERTGG